MVERNPRPAGAEAAKQDPTALVRLQQLDPLTSHRPYDVIRAKAYMETLQ